MEQSWHYTGSTDSFLASLRFAFTSDLSEICTELPLHLFHASPANYAYTACSICIPSNSGFLYPRHKRREAVLELLADPHAWMAFVTLTALELVLGIDNIIFISILVDKLPAERREFARKLGLFIAMFMRIGLLMILAWIVGLTAPLFTVMQQDISGRDLILIGGGLFLIWKSTGEIHQALEGEEGHSSSAVKATFTAVILQIMVVDLVFSLDSIITAVGMVDELAVMVAAVIASVGLMMVFAGPIGRFVSAHPSIKMLALAFLVAIGVVLIAEGFDQHIPKGYIYTAMGFALIVELINIRARKKAAQPVKLHAPYANDKATPPE